MLYSPIDEDPSSRSITSELQKLEKEVDLHADSFQSDVRHPHGPSDSSEDDDHLAGSRSSSFDDVATGHTVDANEAVALAASFSDDECFEEFTRQDTADWGHDYAADTDAPAQYCAPLSLYPCEPLAETNHLDLDEQRALVGFERRQKFTEYHERMMAEQQLPASDQPIAVRMLVTEARRKHIAALQGANAPAARLATCEASWRDIAQEVECDLSDGDSAFVLRRLSCMCIFSPTLADRTYTDNESERQARTHRQYMLLTRLQVQASCGGNAYFVDTQPEA